MSAVFAHADQRRFSRVEFFLVPTEHEPWPVWVFKPQMLAQERGGVVVNISEGGLQILSANAPSLDAERFELRLLLGEDEHVPLFSGPVRRVWQREVSHQAQQLGLEFETPNSLAEQFLQTQTHHVAARQWVRCVLVPLQQWQTRDAPRAQPVRCQVRRTRESTASPLAPTGTPARHASSLGRDSGREMQ